MKKKSKRIITKSERNRYPGLGRLTEEEYNEIRKLENIPVVIGKVYADKRLPSREEIDKKYVIFRDPIVFLRWDGTFGFTSSNELPECYYEGELGLSKSPDEKIYNYVKNKVVNKTIK